MPIDDPAYLLAQAGRFRRIAPHLNTSDARDTILRLADEIELRAELAIHRADSPSDPAPYIRLPKHQW